MHRSGSTSEEYSGAKGGSIQRRDATADILVDVSIGLAAKLVNRAHRDVVDRFGLDRMIALSLGRPLGIDEGDVDQPVGMWRFSQGLIFVELTKASDSFQETFPVT